MAVGPCPLETGVLAVKGDMESITSKTVQSSRTGSLTRTSSAFDVGYLQFWLLRLSVISRNWTLTLLICVVMNYCISRTAAELKPGIPTLKPAGIKILRVPDVKYFRYLNLDENNQKLYIGAMNYVIRINDISDITKSYDKTDRLNQSSLFNTDANSCNSWFPSDVEHECQNHIRAVIPLVNGSIEICGTSAYNPRIFMLHPSHFQVSSDSLYKTSSKGLGVCPPSPNATCNIIYVREGNPGNVPVTYSATILGFSTARPLIYRPAIPGYSNLLRTENLDTKWLNEPYFVQSFDVGKYVYFFFREHAIEYMNCGKAVYSRVARVCKNDRGGKKVLQSRFTSYFKARLNCSIPGNYPFYFNELYDVYRIGDVFYGLFRTYNNGLFGSAVCAFTNEDINKTFEGPFKEQKESTSNWQTVPSSREPNPRPGQCSEDSTNISDDVLQFSKARPLMDLSVQMFMGHPVFYEQEIMYEKMVVLKRNRFTIYMLATDNGQIHKVLSWLDGQTYQHKVITVWNGFADNEQIQQLKLFNDSLYLSTDTQVIQIPVSQCDGYQYCTQCIQDPDCGWNNNAAKCQPYIDNAALIQDVTASIPEKVCTDACKQGQVVKQRQRVYGEAIHLDCQSKCEPSSEVHWFFNNVLIIPDELKFFQTVNNSLIMLNVTASDSGSYRCQSQGVVLKEHYVYVTDCHDPETCWRYEFRDWCIKFEKYQKDMEFWRCQKDKVKENCLVDTESCKWND